MSDEEISLFIKLSLESKIFFIASMENFIRDFIKEIDTIRQKEINISDEIKIIENIKTSLKKVKNKELLQELKLLEEYYHNTHAILQDMHLQEVKINSLLSLFSKLKYSLKEEFYLNDITQKEAIFYTYKLSLLKEVENLNLKIIEYKNLIFVIQKLI